VQGLVADDRELRRQAPSYMIETLQSLRAEYPYHSLCLILGMDAFLGLPHWYQWEKLIEYAHLVVVQRLGKLAPMGKTIKDFLNIHQVTAPEMLKNKLAGTILVQEIPILTISATQIRGLIAAGKRPQYLLPPAVLQLIDTHQLYR
jgi:nicotinate-nucleotide adenylyltransferase